MRLDSGNFTPDQVDWVARALDKWVAPLSLTPPPGTGANFYVDLSGTQGLNRQEKPRAGGRLMFLDATAVYARVVERMRLLPDRDDDTDLGVLRKRRRRELENREQGRDCKQKR